MFEFIVEHFSSSSSFSALSFHVQLSTTRLPVRLLLSRCKKQLASRRHRRKYRCLTDFLAMNPLNIQVGPLTDHYQTQCFSSHLTTFAGGFLVLPTPINWSYVFAHADFTRNLTVYLTVISLSVLYLLLVIYARYKDRKDVEKVRIHLAGDRSIVSVSSWERCHCLTMINEIRISIRSSFSRVNGKMREPSLR